MFVSLLIFVLGTTLPYIVWRNHRTSSSLFFSAALIWAFYATVRILIDGLSKSFEFEGTQVTISYWESHLTLVGSYVIAAFSLKFMEKWRMLPNQRIMFVLFWCYNIAVLLSVSITNIFVGYGYPPIWYETFSPEQLGIMNLATALTNTVSRLSTWVFLGLIAWQLARRVPSVSRRIPTALSRLLALIRSY